MADKNNNLISIPCFIGTTTHFAGVFLSRKIAARTPYSKYLRLEEFEDFSSALNEFFIRYPALNDCNEFTLNKLFRIKEPSLYSVFSTLEHVVITEDKNCFENIEILLPDDWREAYVKGGLTYEEAQEYARMRFVKIYKNPSFYITFPLRVNVPVNFSYVCSKRNNLYRYNYKRRK